MAGARDLGFGSSFADADTDNAKLLRFKSGQPGYSERPSRDSGSTRHAAAPQGPPGPNSAKVHCLCTQCPAPGGLLGQVQPRGRAPVSLTNSMCSGHPHLPGKDGHAQTRHPRAPPRTGPEHRAGPRPQPHALRAVPAAHLQAAPAQRRPASPRPPAAVPGAGRCARVPRQRPRTYYYSRRGRWREPRRVCVVYPSTFPSPMRVAEGGPGRCRPCGGLRCARTLGCGPRTFAVYSRQARAAPRGTLRVAHSKRHPKKRPGTASPAPSTCEPPPAALSRVTACGRGRRGPCAAPCGGGGGDQAGTQVGAETSSDPGGTGREGTFPEFRSDKPATQSQHQ